MVNVSDKLFACFSNSWRDGLNAECKTGKLGNGMVHLQ